jgi:hypothetical protein
MAALTMQQAGYSCGIHFGPDIVLREPEIASAAMNVIANFAEVESAMGGLLAVMLSGASSPVVAMYNSLKASGVQREALKSVAQDVLDNKCYKLFSAIVKIYETCTVERNKIAHWTWGYADEIPNALLLMSPKQRVLQRQDWESFFSSLTVGVRSGLDHPLPNYGEILIYRAADFADVTTSLNRVASFVACFHGVAMRNQPDLRASVFEALSSEPEIAKILKPKK